jgi:phosphotransferase system HPr-like phosphotransfer protein
LTVTNDLTQAVNVYVVLSGTERLLQQVAAKSTADLPVAGLAQGTIVRLKATTADGTKTYTKDGVALAVRSTWTVP